MLIVLVTCRRVSEDRSGDDVGTMDAGDPAPPVVSKSKKRKMKKKAARATPPSYPSPQALEAARVKQEVLGL